MGGVADVHTCSLCLFVRLVPAGAQGAFIEAAQETLHIFESKASTCCVVDDPDVCRGAHTQAVHEHPCTGLEDAASVVSVKQGGAFLACDGDAPTSKFCEPGAEATDGMGSDLTSSVSYKS